MKLIMPCVNSTKAARLILACAFTAVMAPVAVSHAAETRNTASESNKAAALPVTAAFEKGESKEGGPFTLKLKNTSSESLKVSVKVLLAVAYHAENKAKNLPETTLAAGKEQSFPGLAADDRVVVTAAGYAPLTLTVK